MSTVTELTYTGAAVVDRYDEIYHKDYHIDYDESGTAIIDTNTTLKYLMVRFPAVPSEIRYKKLLGVRCGLAIAKSGTTTAAVVCYSMAGNFDPDTVTWETAPAVAPRSWGLSMINSTSIIAPDDIDFPASYWDDDVQYTDPVKIAEISKIVLRSNSVAFRLTPKSVYYKFSGPITMKIEVDESVTVTSQIKPENAPTSGWINPTIAHTFAWVFDYDGDYPCPGEFEQASAVFHWRAGTSGSWTDVTPTNSAQSVTIPANTFPGGTIQWYVSGTDTQGTSSQTDVYTLTTNDSEAIATPLVPGGTIEDGSAPITFRWSIAIDTGSTPTGSDLQKSTDGTSWSTFEQLSGDGTEYTAPANTFSVGKVFWRVRSYNRDGTAGRWSDPLQFVNMSAPPAPSVSALAVPYATINWQSSGQIAYRVTVDSTVYGPYFGTAKSFTLPDYLSDGSHTASVEVQGAYGLWSQPGSVTFTVTNVPGDAVSLSGRFDRDAFLSWETDSETADFHIFRDSVRIGHTTGTTFLDRFVLGEHEYFVINKLPGGYYTRSNLTAGIMRSCVRAVAAYDGGVWLEMALSDDSDTVEDFTWSQVISERYITGTPWPVVETSPYRDASGSYHISFGDVETCMAFEALRGRRIIVKSRGGNVIIGVLSGYSKTMSNFYITYVFSVRACSWEDYVDDA